jgi:hypothetical protein
LAGFESIIPQTTARASTCRSAWVASKVAGGDRHPPGGDLLRAKLRKAAAAEGTERLGEQPAELLDRLRFRVVLGDVLLDEFLQRQRTADAFLSTEMFELPFECFRRVTLGEEASPL